MCAAAILSVVPGMGAVRGIALLAKIPDRQRRDGRLGFVIRRDRPMISMPMVARLWDQIGELVQELARREFHDAAGARLRGRLLPAGPDPVGRLVPGQRGNVLPVRGAGSPPLLGKY
jgi:hypothetical protein